MGNLQFNREKKSLSHVAMVAKFLDDNNQKRSLKIVSDFIDLVQFQLICQMLAKFTGVKSERTYLSLEMSKKRDARVKLLFCYSKLIAFLSFSLLSPSSLLELPIAVIQKFCYHGNMTSHFSSLFQLMIWKAPRPHTVIHRVIFCSLRLAAKILRFSET